MAIKFFYATFIGILLAALVGIGISAFYPGPKYPEYREEPQVTAPTPAEDLQNKAYQERFNREIKDYDAKYPIYNRNVSIVTIIISVIIFIISIILSSKILIIADGLLLGSVFTLIYSVIRGFGSNNQQFLFVIVLISFIIGLLIGYIKFLKPRSTNIQPHV